MGQIRAFSPHIKWTDAEIAILFDGYSSEMPIEILLERLPGRSISQIQNKANGLGLKRPKPSPMTIEQKREGKRLHMAKRRQTNADEVRQYNRNYYQANRDKRREQLRQYQKRRFFWMRANKLTGITAKDLAKLWKQQRGFCALTGERLTRENAQVDHILPKTRGGTDAIENLRWVTQTVNYCKRNLTDAEFYALCENVMQWIGLRIAMFEELKYILADADSDEPISPGDDDGLDGRAY